jgi:hypothetical protein
LETLTCVYLTSSREFVSVSTNESWRGSSVHSVVDRGSGVGAVRWAGVLLAVGLGAYASACGGTGESTATRASSAATAGGVVSRTTNTGPGAKGILATKPTSQGARGLGLDAPVSPDDRRHFGFYGHPADASDRQAIVAVIKRYYAVAAEENAKKACTLIVPSLAKALPLEYGQLGAPYLRGAKTCQGVLSRMFKHGHHELSAPITVIGVFIKGEQAYAPIDSKRLALSRITLGQVRGTWTITDPLAGRLPVASVSRNGHSGGG